MGQPLILYLHGFASSPASTKARAVAEHLADRGVEVARLDLRRPSFEHLRLSAMMAEVERHLGGSATRAVIVGSSLGGLCAARVAVRDARVVGLFLMAPAFDIARRWRARLGPDFERWREQGWLEVDDHLTGGTSTVDFGFYEEIDRFDREVGVLPDVRVPVRVVHGLRDDVVDVGVSRAFVASRRDAHLVEVDDGHELRESLPRILVELDDFLGRFVTEKIDASH